MCLMKKKKKKKKKKPAVLSFIAKLMNFNSKKIF